MTARVMGSLFRLVLFALLWTVLTGADGNRLGIAAVTVVSASAISLRLWPPGPGGIRLSRLPALMVYFLWNSVKGGVDVARRVFSRAMPVMPEVIDYRCTIEGETGRVLFAWMVGLMPGTASVDWDDRGRIAVHVIDSRMYDENNLRELEKKLAAVLEPWT